ncbi:MAG: calcium/sodium antiporter [Gammaproteobacteria bacterium]|jgi:cation:H+ antiporter|nr:calcium/sodium antiporter [Gammaproteobacteria bacterium]MBT3859921.1 calcium/sodium antiporter [Gammaproteobacteria bacterium]MBT3986383.1 calcium/sodium antiporter [Gammaproteobacteria bacterium]MBT4255024.1 calcium/sodium antiporter [Gammaproteobacteria bacterium]MBT4582943.1 calcium/sodium antiporter [Gammaproteobacteria bacterium]
MFLDTAIIVLGFVGLIWGADKFVFGASAMARNLGVSPLMIGLTIVAFGTSAPEIFSSAASALNNKPELAIGNALGSNLFNVGVALGIAAIISPLKPPESLIGKEIPALLLVTVITGVLLFDLYLGFFDALILIAITVYFGYKLFRKKSKTGVAPDIDEESLDHVSSLQAVAYLILGLALLILSATALVEAASSIADSFGVSTAIIGLTIVALGTSLPELAASVTCVLKGHHDLAIGNIVGSNILNLLAVLPFPGLFSPGLIEPNLLYRDYTFVLLLTVMLAYFCYTGIKKKKMIGRFSGLMFISIYCGWFTVMLVQLSAQ